jgi:conjugative transfer pilus assembly protein TraH
MIKKILIIILISNLAHATIDNDLKDFFASVGMKSNVSTSGAFQDQAAGYYTGGSLSARNSVKSAQLATLQMPGYRAGCGGIDAWTGGFSHISSQELVNTLKSVGSATLSYAMLLTMQTISPVVYNTVNELNAIATKVNNFNINSCEVAATMLGGVWPKSDQASKHLCQTMGTDLGGMSDWAAARHECGTKGARHNTLKNFGSDPRYKNMLVGEFNLTWKALQNNAFLQSDQELAELFMTLVGSIINKRIIASEKTRKGETKDKYVPTTLPAHLDQDSVLNGLLNGGKTAIYVCDTKEQCLHPVLQELNLPAANGFRYKVQNTLSTLIDKIHDDAAITEVEKDFLNATRLPVYKMLNVTTAYTKGTSPLNVEQYGDLIALDILYKYLMDIIDLVHDSVIHLKSVQVEGEQIDSFLKQLKLARERVTMRRTSAFQQMDNILSFIQSTQVVEKQLHVMLGGVANENNWF